DRGTGLGDLLRSGLVGLAGGVDDAVADVVLEQAEADPLQRLGRRRDLGEDVDAVRVVLDHARYAPYLALDALEPREVLLLASAVSRHVSSSGLRVLCNRIPARGISGQVMTRKSGLSGSTR